MSRALSWYLPSTVKAYVKVYQSAHTGIGVKDLTAILLADFDSWFRPADEDGKVTYTEKANVGFRNRYIAPHPFLFVASFLDPRAKGLFRGNKEHVSYIMLPNQYEDLKRDVMDHMIALIYKNKDSKEHDNDTRIRETTRTSTSMSEWLFEF